MALTNKFALPPISDSVSVPELYVFLLPNDLYSNLTLFPSFERQLRNPAFPSICDLQEIGKNGTFFYMQFDCMHVVYPIDKSSDRYFRTFHQYGYSREQNHFPSTMLRKMAFPPALLAINLARAIATVEGIMTFRPDSRSPKYKSMLASVHHYKKWTLPTKELPRYDVQETDRDMDYPVISYEEEYTKLDDDSSELKKRSFKDKCNDKAESVSILRDIRKVCNVQPGQFRQMRDCGLIEKWGKLFDNVKKRLISPKENESEYLSLWISDCEKSFEKHLKTKYLSLQAPIEETGTVTTVQGAEKLPIEETGTVTTVQGAEKYPVEETEFKDDYHQYLDRQSAPVSRR